MDSSQKSDVKGSTHERSPDPIHTLASQQVLRAWEADIDLSQSFSSMAHLSEASPSPTPTVKQESPQYAESNQEETQGQANMGDESVIHNSNQAKNPFAVTEELRKAYAPRERPRGYRPLVDRRTASYRFPAGEELRKTNPEFFRTETEGDRAHLVSNDNVARPKADTNIQPRRGTTLPTRKSSRLANVVQQHIDREEEAPVAAGENIMSSIELEEDEKQEYMLSARKPTRARGKARDDAYESEEREEGYMGEEDAYLPGAKRKRSIGVTPRLAKARQSQIPGEENSSDEYEDSNDGESDDDGEDPQDVQGPVMPLHGSFWTKSQPQPHPLRFETPADKNGRVKVVTYKNSVDWSSGESVRRANKTRAQRIRRDNERFGIEARRRETVVWYTKRQTTWIADQYRQDPDIGNDTLRDRFNSHFNQDRSNASLQSHANRTEEIRGARGLGPYVRVSKSEAAQRRVRAAEPPYTARQDAYLREQHSLNPDLAMTTLARRYNKAFPTAKRTSKSLHWHVTNVLSLGFGKATAGAAGGDEDEEEAEDEEENQ